MSYWKTPVYNAQVVTAQLANQLAGNYRDVLKADAYEDIIEISRKPPYCLRILKPYRTPEMQAFRDQVAREMRALRAQRTH